MRRNLKEILKNVVHGGIGYIRDVVSFLNYEIKYKFSIYHEHYVVVRISR